MTLGTNSASRETSNSLRNAVRRIVEASWFTSFITLIIIANAITLGAATYDNLPPALHAAFALFDQFVIVVFVLEIMLKFFAYRWGFFRRRAGFSIGLGSRQHSALTRPPPRFGSPRG